IGSRRHHVLSLSAINRRLPDDTSRGSWKGSDMFTPEQFRAKAAEYAERVKGSTVASETREFQALEKRFTALANNEQWLAGNYDKQAHGGAWQPHTTTPTTG